MTKAIETLTGTDLTDFREAMLRAGIQCLLGKALAVNLNVAGSTAVTLNRNGHVVVITRIVGTNHSGTAGNASFEANTASDGSGIYMAAYPSFDGSNYNKNVAVSTQVSASGTAGGIAVDQDTIYLRVTSPEGNAATCDFYVFGHYADPA